MPSASMDISRSHDRLRLRLTTFRVGSYAASGGVSWLGNAEWSSFCGVGIVIKDIRGTQWSLRFAQCM